MTPTTSENDRPPADRPIVGVFDSATGGFVVLAELLRLRPDVDVSYWADTARLPLGNLPSMAICEATVAGVAQLLAGSSGGARPQRTAGATVIVLACHTASAWALNLVRARWPELTVIDMVEATVDAAQAATGSGRVGLVGTEATVQAGAHVRLATGRGLTMVSTSSATLGTMLHAGSSRAALRGEVDRLVESVMLHSIDTLVLACTAFTHVEDLFIDAVGPDIRVVSPDRRVARQVASSLPEIPRRTSPRSRPDSSPSDELGEPGRGPTPGRTVIWHTGPEAGLTLAAQRLLPPACEPTVLSIRHVEPTSRVGSSRRRVCESGRGASELGEVPGPVGVVAVAAETRSRWRQ